MTQRVSAVDAARQLFDAAIAKVDASKLTARVRGDLLHRGKAIAVGKAAVAMARGLSGEGLIVTKDGHELGAPPGWEVRVASHPWPDARSVAAAEALLAIARAVSPSDELVVAVSGGASALAALPAPGLSLDDKIAATRAVAASGAGIHELNTVRKHLSSIKGGQLAAACPGRVRVLVLSDVVGDDMATVGGGLGVEDPTTLDSARAILESCRGVPEAALRHLRETPKSLPRVRVERVAGPSDLLAAVACDERVANVTSSVEELAERLVTRAHGGPGVLAIGGEPTIRLPTNPGRGGRAQHTALLCARALAAAPPVREVAILCAGSDGTDGPTADAGAVVDATTAARIGDLDGALARYDSNPALAEAGSLVTTGPTGTNLCDLYLVVVQ
jgi:glycerate-2-kinase